MTLLSQKTVHKIMLLLIYSGMISFVFSDLFARIFLFFSFDSFETKSLGEMVLLLLDSFYITFFKSTSGILFTILPIILLIIRMTNLYDLYLLIIIPLSKFVSVISYFVYLSAFIGVSNYNSLLEDNVVGRLFLVDFVQMWAWSFVLVSQFKISFWEFLAGPLFVIAKFSEITVKKESIRTRNFNLFILVIFTAIPSLYNAHTVMIERNQKNILKGDLDYIDWNPLQLQSFIQIIAGFCVLCVLIPPIKSVYSFIFTIGLIVVANGNIAAASVLYLCTD